MCGNIIVPRLSQSARKEEDAQGSEWAQYQLTVQFYVPDRPRHRANGRNVEFRIEKNENDASIISSFSTHKTLYLYHPPFPRDRRAMAQARASDKKRAFAFDGHQRSYSVPE